MKNQYAALERLKTSIYDRKCLLSLRSGYNRGRKRVHPPGVMVRQVRPHREPDPMLTRLNQQIVIAESLIKAVIFSDRELYELYVDIVKVKGNGLIRAASMLIVMLQKEDGQPREAA